MAAFPIIQKGNESVIFALFLFLLFSVASVFGFCSVFLTGVILRLPAEAAISLSWPLIVNPGGETVSLSEVLAKDSVHVIGSDWLTSPLLTHGLM